MYEAAVVSDVQSAQNLAQAIQNPRRLHPVVVVTVGIGESASWIDAEQIASQAGDLVDVYVITNVDASWEFARKMPEGAQVYGGAGRIYPMGSDYLVNKFLSPLHIAFDARDGARITQTLISEALAMSFNSGHASSSTAIQKKAEGVVQGFAAGRAVIELERGGYAYIAAELTLTGFSVEELFARKQKVSGRLNPETNRLDVVDSLLSHHAALATYEIGDVVLAQVKDIYEDSVNLSLYPAVVEKEVCVYVPKEMVTGNPLDDLRDLMTPGDVVSARVIGTSPNWALVLTEIDDDEPISLTPSILPGGPAWLKQVEFNLFEESNVDANEPLSNLLSDVHEDAVELAPKHGRKLTEQLLLAIESKKAQTSSLTDQVVILGAHLEQAERDRELLRRELQNLKREFNLIESSLTKIRAKFRKINSSKSQTQDLPIFFDPDQGFRHLVTAQWALRLPFNQQKETPLKEYILGPNFLESLDNLQGISREKVADVVVEIATGIANELAGREVHR